MQSVKLYQFLESAALLRNWKDLTISSIPYYLWPMMIFRASQKSHGSAKTRRLRRQKKERKSVTRRAAARRVTLFLSFREGWGGEHIRRLLRNPLQRVSAALSGRYESWCRQIENRLQWYPNGNVDNYVDKCSKLWITWHSALPDTTI